MLILVTMQQPGCVRTRYLIEAPSTFEAVAKVMHHTPDFNPDTYIAARPATTQDHQTHAFWSI
jgi:hypothetical protein